jgi:tetratricopeptide (TPR) repeat protein
LKPRDADALSAMGNTKYDAGDFVAAAGFYERVLAVQPQNADVQTDLGNTYFQRQPPDFRRAIEEYRKTLKIDPRHEKALQNIAAAALQLDDKASALEAVRQLASINPSNPTLEALRERAEAAP